MVLTTISPVGGSVAAAKSADDGWAPTPALAPVAAPVFTNDLRLHVRKAARTSKTLTVAAVVDPTITTYKFAIVEDNTGVPTQSDTLCRPATNPSLAGCEWPSIHAVPGYAPIVVQGDQTQLSDATLLALPSGRYFISVTSAGYKIGGTAFSIPLSGPLTVELQPEPLPLATVRVKVFEDNLSANGQFDEGAEHGLAGFVVHLNEILGEVTTDWYANPLCTIYARDGAGAVIFDAEGSPVIETLGGECLSDANGDVEIPNLGPNRYDVDVTPPDGSLWVQTTTLEGGKGWDVWPMEGATGFDTEFLQGQEPFPLVQAGFVMPDNTFPTAGTGTITGRVVGMKTYTPPAGGVPIAGELGFSGAKIDKPIPYAWIALTDMRANDETVWVGKGDATGAFTIPAVPASDYQVTVWDDQLSFLMDLENVSVANGQAVDMGIMPLANWYSHFDGYIYYDTNLNGKRDPGERGVPGFVLTLRTRNNTLEDQFANAATTNTSGYYTFYDTYPVGHFLVIEAYSDVLYTTGITYQADNQPTETTILGAGVDVSVLPIFGLSGRLDWGVQPYAAGTNGGIVGTVSYDTTRNELDPRLAAVEDWQPGIPGLNVNLYRPIKDPADPTGATYLKNADGSYQRGPLINQYLTETWERPTGCVARDMNGNLLAQQAFPTSLPVADRACIEAPMMSVQVQSGFSSVNGNYGFGDMCPGVFQPDTALCYSESGPLSLSGAISDTATDLLVTAAALPAGWPTAGTVDIDGEQITYTGAAPSGTGTQLTGLTRGANDTTAGSHPDGAPVNLILEHVALPTGEYLVAVEVPNDLLGQPTYRVTKEEDINIFDGNAFSPSVPPPPCAGKLHVVDVAGFGQDGKYDAVTNPSGYDSPYALGAVENPNFAADGVPFEGQTRPLCDQKLVTVNDRRSVAPTFNFFTDVPPPGRYYGYIVDDLALSTNPKDTLYGEKKGIANAAIGVYDFLDNHVATTQADPNGLFELLLPSTQNINCPTPSGVCPNMFRLVGNDPGRPGHLNPTYTPQYRTITANFQSWPGIMLPVDLAPTQIATLLGAPGTGQTPVQCPVAATTPQFFAVSDPVVTAGGSVAARSRTITGRGFGASQGTGAVMLGTTAADITSWSDTQIGITVPSGLAGGAYQLQVTANGGQTATNGVTIHAIGGTYTPDVRRVGPGLTGPGTYAAIQPAIEAAASSSNARDLIVVYPGTGATFNPLGAYYENLVMHSPLKLQGVGPGGVLPSGAQVQGSVIDGIGWGSDLPRETDWYDIVNNLNFVGNPDIYDGAVITVFAESTGQFGAAYRAGIDGFTIQGGNQAGFPGNLGEITGTLPAEGEAGAVVTQGGGIFVNGYGRNLQITNNVLRGNGGAYGGAIRIGTPYVGDNQNDNIRVANNRIIANGGTNLAGAIAVFTGADNYEIANNDVCGNFSAEYGGGISHFGLSPNALIHDNRIYFNQSYDEGAGITIAGELVPAGTLSDGSGRVSIYNNVIQSNLANDDGGGIRLLMAGDHRIDIYNNNIVNNISTHEGGGIAVDDATNVRFVNNTVMKNITTATAATSDGLPMPAGLSDTGISAVLKASILPVVKDFSDPVMFNNIFSDNRAGSWNGATVSGIGLAGDASPVNNWDMGVTGAIGLLSPMYTLLQTTLGTRLAGNPAGYNPHNINNANAGVIQTFDTTIGVLPWRTDPHFVGAVMIAIDSPAELMGNYHLAASSLAIDRGIGAVGAVSAPTTDIDGDNRGATAPTDIGADEYKPVFTFGAALEPLTCTPCPGPLSANWAGTTSAFRVISASSGAGFVPAAATSGVIQVNRSGVAYWKDTFGADQDAYFTFRKVSQTALAQTLLLKLSNTKGQVGIAATNRERELGQLATSLIAVTYDGFRRSVSVETVAPGQGLLVRGEIRGVTFAAGESFGARARSDGSVTIYKRLANGNESTLGAVDLTKGAKPWPSALNAGGGNIGVLFLGLFAFNQDTQFDSFGGGTVR